MLVLEESCIRDGDSSWHGTDVIEAVLGEFAEMKERLRPSGGAANTPKRSVHFRT